VVRAFWAAATSEGLQVSSTQTPAASKKASLLHRHLKLVMLVQLLLETASVAQVVAHVGVL